MSTIDDLLPRARSGEGSFPCRCGCGVLWHTRPVTDPCCKACDGYWWTGAVA